MLEYDFKACMLQYLNNNLNFTLLLLSGLSNVAAE